MVIRSLRVRVARVIMHRIRVKVIRVILGVLMLFYIFKMTFENILGGYVN